MSKINKRHPGWVVLFFLASVGFAGSPPAKEDGPIYLKAGKIYTSGKIGVVENGGMLVAGKKIVRIDRKIKPPADARVIDLADKIIIPGLIDAQCYLGFHDKDFSVKTEPSPSPFVALSPWLRAAEAEPAPVPEVRTLSVRGIFYGDQAFGKSLARGVTTAKVAMPTDVLIGGTSACVKVSADSWPDFILKSPAGAEFSIAAKENVMGRYGELKKLFLDAIEYEKSFRKFDKDLRAYLEQNKGKVSKEAEPALKGEKASPPLEEPKEPQKDENQEAVLQVLHRKIPAMIRASRINEIEAALKIAEEFKVDLILVGGQEAYKIVDVLAQRKIPVIAGPDAVYVKKGEKINYIKDLLRKNVVVGFGSWTRGGDSDLLYQLTYAMQYGLTAQEALHVLTAGAAGILGVADRVGSLEAGKDADFVVLSGEPFQFETRVETVYVDGRPAFRWK
jgi:imidazolonepropionase-like amidohydrolase